MPGHPDGQNYAIWRGPQFLASVSQGLNSVTPINASGQVTNFASLVLNVNGGSASGVTVTVSWFTDQTATLLLFNQVWNVPAGTQLSVIIPCVGNFVQVQITTPAVPIIHIAVSIYPTNTPVSAPRYFSVGNEVSGNFRSIAASTTVIASLPRIASGEGHFFLRDDVNSGKFNIAIGTLNLDGTFNIPMVTQDPLTTGFFGDLRCPDDPLGIFIQNLDGVAAHTLTYLFNVDGR